MMFEELMIQLGVQLNLCRISNVAGGLGGAAAPPMMLEEGMIQVGAQ